MNRFWRLGICLLLALMPLMGIRSEPRTATAAVDPYAMAASLAPGMNLPWWFWFSGPAWDTLGTRYTRAELQAYYDAGIRGVRIPTDYYLMAASNGSSELNTANIAKLDAAIAICLDIGFNLIVNVHNAVPEWDGEDISNRIQNSTSFRNTFIAFWENYADHLSQYPTDRIVLEPLNEPIFTSNKALWTDTIAPALVNSIRDGAPGNTILLSGPQWSSPFEIDNFDPDLIGDSNVIYNLHFYEPFFFTHQGASWVGSTEIEAMRKVPYPSTPERVAAILPLQTNQNARDWLVGYGEERWGPDDLAAILDEGIDWAEANNVPVMVTEFGVLRDWSDPIDRARWYRDVRLHLEDRDVPWMIWSDLGGFGFDFEEGSFETRILIALGLLPGSIETPKITVSSSSASPGTRITASGTGFTPGTTLRLNLSGIDVANGTTRSDGSATIAFRVPNLTTASRSLKIFASDGLKASTPLAIFATVKVEPTSGKAGSTTRVRLYGFGRNEAVTLSFRQGNQQTRLIRVMVDATGTLGVTARIPSTAVVGLATVVANGQVSYVTTTFSVTGLAPSEDPTATPTATATVSPEPTGTLEPTPTLTSEQPTETATLEPPTTTPTLTAASPTETASPTPEIQTQTPEPTATDVVIEPTEVAVSPTPSPEP